MECPECGSKFFYVDWQGSMVTFSVDSDGCAVDCEPAIPGFALTPDTIVYCTVCAWSGPVRELEHPA
jgi:hypothetical protein